MDTDQASTARIQVTARFEGGLSWSLAGASMLACRAHALVTDDGVWLVDPIDAPGLDELLATLGRVRGVLVLLDRHLRDSAQLAERHGARLIVPRGEWRRGHPMPDGAEQFEPGPLAGTPFEVAPVIERGGQWLEWLLWWQQRRILVIAEVVGRSTVYEPSPHGAGLHPALHVMGAPDPLVEGSLRERIEAAPVRLLLGHGELESTTRLASIEEPLHGARRRLPKLVMRAPGLAWQLWRGGRSGARTGC